ncbi:MAG: hypothetical protein V5A62_07480 [Haloarculaceae archaeon]
MSSPGTTAPSALAYVRALRAMARPSQLLLIATVFALGLAVAVTAGLFASGLLSTAAAALLSAIAVLGWGYSLPPVVVWASLLALPFAAWGVATFTRDERPLPTVAAMAVMAVAQLAAWSYVAGLV